MKDLNPATKKIPDAERRRIPMSVPVQKLEVPEIPGFHLHWFRGDTARIKRAQEGGYTFVDEQETVVNSVGLGNESTRSGNTDLGSLVSVVAGGNDIGRDGQPVRLILMKIPLEYYEEDQKLVEQRNHRVAEALTGGQLGVERDGPGDTSMRYVGSRTSIPDLFNPNKKRA